MSRQTTDAKPALPRLAYTVAEVAAALNLPIYTVRRLIRDEHIRARWTGRQYVIPRAAIDDYLAATG